MDVEVKKLREKLGIQANIIATPVFDDYGFRVAQYRDLLEKLGLTWYYWHEQLVKIITAFDPKTGFPIYDRINFIGNRQIGKSQISFIGPFDHMIRPELKNGSFSYYTSLGTSNASDILEDKFYPLVEDENFELKGHQFKLNRGNTAPGITNLSNSRRMRVLSASDKSGRGPSPDLVLIDEALELRNYSRIDSLTGGQTNKNFAQLIMMSTAPKDYSFVLHREVEEALRRLNEYNETGDRSVLGSTAIFMCKVDENLDPWSDEAILSANPSVGLPYGPSLRKLRNIRDGLRYTNPDGWRNEYLGIHVPLKTKLDETQFNHERIKLIDKIEFEPHISAIVCNPEKTEWYASVSDGKKIKFLGVFGRKKEAVESIKSFGIFQIVHSHIDVEGFVNYEVEKKDYNEACHLFEEGVKKEIIELENNDIINEFENVKKAISADADDFKYQPIDRNINGIWGMKSVVLALYFANKHKKMTFEEMFKW